MYVASVAGELSRKLPSPQAFRLRSIEVALARVASSVYGILATTHLAGAREIRLVEAQSFIANPPCEFTVERIR